MRFVFLSLDFGLLLLAIIALLHTRETSARPDEVCRQGNCVSPDKCEIPTGRSLECDNPNETCCSLVRVEARTLCQHWGGECMNDCNERITQRSVDCAAPQKCCVLI